MSNVLAQFDGMTAEELVLWKRPQATGVVVGVIATWLFLLGYLEYSFLTLSCRFFQVAAVAWFAAAKLNYAPTLTRTDIQDVLKKGLDAAEPYVVKYLGMLVDIISWQDTAFTTKVFIGSILLSYIGTMFSDLTLVFLLTVGVFAGPITYIQNQEVIDAQIAKAKPIINEYMSKIPMLNASSVDQQKKTQ